MSSSHGDLDHESESLHYSRGDCSGCWAAVSGGPRANPQDWEPGRSLRWPSLGHWSRETTAVRQSRGRSPGLPKLLRVQLTALFLLLSGSPAARATGSERPWRLASTRMDRNEFLQCSMEQRAIRWSARLSWPSSRPLGCWGTNRFWSSPAVVWPWTIHFTFAGTGNTSWLIVGSRSPATECRPQGFAMDGRCWTGQAPRGSRLCGS